MSALKSGLETMRVLFSSLQELAKMPTSSSPVSQKEKPSEEQGKVIIRERVVTDKQIGAFMDLGLGRGVDATNPTPWLNKSAYQVREVTFDNVIGTEEGNLFQGFVNEVESTQNLQTSLKASVPLSQQVNLGIDSELSRSYSSTKKSVGRKIVTRTIAFRDDYDYVSKMNSQEKIQDVVHGNDQEACTESVQNHQGQDEVKEREEKAKEKTIPFEDRLLDWINKRIIDDTKIKEIESEKRNYCTRKDNPSAELNFDACSYERRSELCYKFVKTFSITHYVHSLELGASHHRVMSEEEYSLKIKSKGSLGAAQIADIAIGVEGSNTSKKLQQQTTKIGRMKRVHDNEGEDEPKKSDLGQEGDASNSLEEEVKRGSIEEAVVGVKVQPISTLVVKNIKLRVALQDALQNFIQNKQKIKCKLKFVCIPLYSDLLLQFLK